MKRLLVCSLILIGAAPLLPARAQVPVTDTKREDKETTTSKCMRLARNYKDSALKPVQGSKASVATPGSAANTVQSAAPVGQTGIMGLGATTNSIEGGLDLSSILQAGAGVGGLDVNAAAQASSAVKAVTGALSSNSAGLSSIGSGVGTLDPVQGAFDQNSAGKVATTGEWGQVIQGTSVTNSLQNAKLLRRLKATSAEAALMQYDPNAATFGGDK